MTTISQSLLLVPHCLALPIYSASFLSPRSFALLLQLILLKSHYDISFFMVLPIMFSLPGLPFHLFSLSSFKPRYRCHLLQEADSLPSPISVPSTCPLCLTHCTASLSVQSGSQIAGCLSVVFLGPITVCGIVNAQEPLTLCVCVMCLCGVCEAKDTCAIL